MSTVLHALLPAAASLAALSLAAASLAAEAPSPAPARDPWNFRHAEIPITIGVTRLTGLERLNTALRASDVEALPAFMPTVAAAITGFYESGLVIEPRYRFTIAASEQATLIVHHALLSFGWVLCSDHEIALFPLLGLGFGNATLDIARSDVGAQPFDEALSEPAGDALFSSSTFVLHAGIASNLWGSGHGDFIGLRTGLVLAPFSTTWKRRGVDVLGGPAAPIDGVYLAVAAGFGAPRRR